jgi:DNA-binding MarR family transcriptional regulator
VVSADLKLRQQTLARMETLLKLLMERYGRRTTLGEMLAITAALRKLCTQDRVTLAEIADATGLPKQSLSRWAKKRVGESILLSVNDEDQRVHDVVLVDSKRGQEPIERFAEVFGIR